MRYATTPREHRVCERQISFIRDSESHAAIQWDRRDSETHPVTTGNSERHAATDWDWRDSERRLVAIEDSERHAATPWIAERLSETS